MQAQTEWENICKENWEKYGTVKNSEKEMTVRIVNVYGNKTIYPVCETSKTFAAIAGTKSLTSQAIAQIKKLGYQINVEQMLI